MTASHSSYPADRAETHGSTATSAWWRHAVIYQIYPRSWADANSDGVGDLPGIISRLPYLRDLGVDALWVSPFYVSPMADAGYDVADYVDIDPVFGSLADADELIARAHELGLRVIVDLVPNHSSDEHEHFQQALAADPGSPERERYIFRDGTGENGEHPPNNWTSVFGGPAWTRVTDRHGDPEQWYLHLFDTKQPDWNWENREIHDFFLDVLRFWLDRGVDGFRVDVAHSLIKDPALPDIVAPATDTAKAEGGTGFGTVTDDSGPMWDQDGVHEVYREWRRLLDGYNPDGDPDKDRILCAEAWVQPLERAARYVRPDEMHQNFNFAFLEAPWQAPALRQVISESLSIAEQVGAPSTWVLSNHDVLRHASRLGLTVGDRRPNGIGSDDPQPNAILGLRRARAATALMLALPGSAYLYQGEELGLPEHTALPDQVRQDPAFARTGGTDAGRDGCRIPFPWEADSVAYGFGNTWDTWLPQPEIYGPLSADRQQGLEGSTLELYRSLLRLRRDLDLGTGTLRWSDDFAEDDAVVAIDVETGMSATVRVITNVTGARVPIPDGAEVLVASSPALSPGTGGVDRFVERDDTVWLRLS